MCDNDRQNKYANNGGLGIAPEFGALFFASFSLLKINMLFDSFWIAFGCHFGSILGAKIDPSRAKFGPSWLLKQYFFEKIFSRKFTKTNEKSIKMTPRGDRK